MGNDDAGRRDFVFGVTGILLMITVAVVVGAVVADEDQRYDVAEVGEALKDSRRGGAMANGQERDRDRGCGGDRVGGGILRRLSRRRAQHDGNFTVRCAARESGLGTVGHRRPPPDRPSPAGAAGLKVSETA